MPEAHSPASVQSVSVDLGARSYDVLVGEDLLAGAGPHLRSRCRRDRVLVVTDETVRDLHLSTLEMAARDEGLTIDAVVVPPGEEAKSWTWLERVVDHLLERDIERGETVWALGGGVVGDLAGFAAAITKRGAPFVQLPTTLLAQVDSSVGGKTAINAGAGKNLIGAFHQPSLVLADTSVLNTLTDDERRAGLAEIIKIAIVSDGGFFSWLETRGGDIVDGGGEATIRAITRAVALKAQIVAEDEEEHGRRALLNLGHTFGHAIEAEAFASLSGGGVPHGFAVSVGTALAAGYAHATGLAQTEVVDRIVRVLNQVGLPTSLSQIDGGPYDPDRMLARMANDKKVDQGAIRLILPDDLGSGRIVRVDDVDRLKEFLKAACGGA